MVRRLSLLSVLLLGVATWSSALAQPQPSAKAQVLQEEEPTKDTEAALREDAEQLAKDMGLSVTEVEYRFGIQWAAGDLEEKLTESASAEFGGLWIEHFPTFAVRVGLTEGGDQVIAPFVAGTGLESVTSVVPVDHSLVELTAWAERILQSKGNLPKFDLGIERATNRVIVRASSAANAASLEARIENVLPVPSRGAISFEIGELSEPNINIYGGLALTTCTVGYSTRTTTGGQRGIATAGHCPPPLGSQSFAGTVLPFQAEDTTGNQDVQWHSLPTGVTAVPKVRDASGTRFVRATRGRANQPEGAMVCSYGKTLGYRCGTLIRKDWSPSYITNASPTFMVVHSFSGADMGNDGDSGGPWYNGTEAWGIHSGTIEDIDAIYMAINYISSLNIAVLLHTA
jgi:hypothetical protein